MSIIDKLLSFDDGSTVTGGTTTTSVDHVDLGKDGLAIGSGRPLYAVFHITAKSGGDAADTFTFSIVTDTSSTFATKRTVAASPQITGIANVPSRIVLPIPPGYAFSRYVRAEYAVTADAVLTVDAFLTDQEPYDHTAYPDAI
ncbi:MAG: hypothetical protein C0P74_014695 [Gammaproteobacteria bacterium]